jgi:hypothetical protein
MDVLGSSSNRTVRLLINIKSFEEHRRMGKYNETLLDLRISTGGLLCRLSLLFGKSAPCAPDIQTEILLVLNKGAIVVLVVVMVLVLSIYVASRLLKDSSGMMR